MPHFDNFGNQGEIKEKRKIDQTASKIKLLLWIWCITPLFKINLNGGLIHCTFNWFPMDWGCYDKKKSKEHQLHSSNQFWHFGNFWFFFEKLHGHDNILNNSYLNVWSFCIKILSSFILYLFAIILFHLLLLLLEWPRIFRKWASLVWDIASSRRGWHL